MHYELCNLLQSDHDKIGVAFPREHGKSTWATYIYPLWKIMNKRPDEGMFIVIVSETRDPEYSTSLAALRERVRRPTKSWGNTMATSAAEQHNAGVKAI